MHSRSGWGVCRGALTHSDCCAAALTTPDEFGSCAGRSGEAKCSCRAPSAVFLVCLVTLAALGFGCTPFRAQRGIPDISELTYFLLLADEPNSSGRISQDARLWPQPSSIANCGSSTDAAAAHDAATAPPARHRRSVSDARRRNTSRRADQDVVGPAAERRRRRRPLPALPAAALVEGSTLADAHFPARLGRRRVVQRLNACGRGDGGPTFSTHRSGT